MSATETAKRWVMKGLLLLFLLVVLAVAAFILMAMLLGDPIYDNFAELAYRDGQVIILQGEDRELLHFPRGSAVFVVRFCGGNSEGCESAWTLRQSWEQSDSGEENNPSVCTSHDQRLALSRVVYGVAPPCFEEEKPALPLKKNGKYFIRSVSSTGTSENAFFKLVDCPKDPLKTCLETNSPYRKDRDEKRRRR